MQAQWDGLHFLLRLLENLPLQSPAMNAGIQSGDKVTRVNGQPIMDWSEISPVVQQFMGKKVLTIRKQLLKHSPLSWKEMATFNL